jgi:hypothetical protein
MDGLPVELIREILVNLKPGIISPIVAEDATWRELNRIPNWWSQSLPTEYHIGFSTPADTNYQYREILPLRLYVSCPTTR